MALVDNVTVARVKRQAGAGLADLGGPEIDWDLILAPALKAAKEALRREVWEWLDAHPGETIFRVRVDTKVWFIPVHINWSVTASDAADFVSFLLGPRPEPA